MDSEEQPDIDAIMRDQTLVQRAIAQGAIDTVIRARKLGHKLVVWKDGAVAEVDPFEIELPQDSQDADS